ncbi:MAG: LUD domain-containing protein [Bacteroidota bacterium]
MDESTSREKVLKNVRNAGIFQADCPFTDIDFSSNVFVEMEEPIDIAFAEAFTKIAGKFVYCEDEKEFVENFKFIAKEQNWNQLFCFEDKIKMWFNEAHIAYSDNKAFITEAQQGVTLCESLISRLGSIMVSSAQASGRRLIVYPDTHIVIAYTSQLVPDLPDALNAISEKYGKQLPSLISVISGPSRTADIEKTLVMGAHGPRELYVFLIDDSKT